jgi:iron complex transport system ATP-binding protein
MIKITNLNFSYGKQKILDLVNLSFEAAQIVSLVGPNGSGKSTLLKCLCRILKTTDKTIFMEGKALEHYSRREMAQLIAYVPQQPTLNLAVSVIDAVKIGRSPYIGYTLSKNDENIVFEVIEQLGLTEHAFRSLRELSGGERQRVLLARVIAQQARILLLDEPTSALDLKNQLETASLLRVIQKQQQLTVIVAIHDLNLAARFSDSVVQLKQGKVYAHGSWDKTMTEQSILEIYGVQTFLGKVQGIPYVVSLNAVPDTVPPPSGIDDEDLPKRGDSK